MRGRAFMFFVLAGLAGCGTRKVIPPDRAGRLLARVRTAHAAGRWRTVRSAARPLVKAHPRTEGSEEALFLSSDAEERLGRQTAAYRKYETLIVEHPTTVRLQEISRREYALASERQARGRHRLKGHFMTFGASVPDVFEDVARHDPYAEHAALALLKAATAHYDAGRWEDAETDLALLLERQPDSPWGPQARFLNGLAAFRKSRGAVYDVVPMQEAEKRFREYLARHPDDPDAEAARRMLVAVADRWAEREVRAARIYRLLKQDGADRLYCQDVLTRWPDSPWAERARLALLPERFRADAR